MGLPSIDEPLRFQRLTPALGVEVCGVDCAAAMAGVTVSTIRRAFAEHGVVLFRDQHLDAPAFAAFSRRFGNLQRSGNQRYAAPDAPEVMLIGNLVVDGEWKSMFTNGKEDWHVDQIYRQSPNAGTALHAVAVPLEGGDTLFASTAAAWDALDAGSRQCIEGLEAVYSFECLDAVLRAQDPTRPPLTEEMRAAYPPATHPLVRLHPETGRRSLYIAPDVMDHVVGMDREAGQALVRRLLAHALDERFVYRHRWREGDLVMWDNRSTLHTATPFDATRYHRLLYRAIIG